MLSAKKMASFLLLTVVLLVGTPCFIVAKPAHKHTLPSLFKSSLRQPQVDCNAVVTEQYCTAGQYQELADVFVKCNMTKEARALEAYCEQNSMKEYCVLVDTTKYGINKTCANTKSCNQACKQSLVSARQGIGCCIPSFFNNSDISPPDDMFKYSLWSSCGVEPVTQKCPPSGIVVPSPPADPSCTEAVVNADIQSITCRQKFVEGIRNKLSNTEGCQHEPYFNDTTCHANSQNVYCDLMDVKSNFTAGSAVCTDTSICAQKCVDVIQSISDTSGCCFMDAYSKYNSDWLKPDFWDQCGVILPDLCKEYLNNDTPTTST